ncbi:hypothetical protein BDW42DRAFT_181148, partial [Aspergillus taichungensis]
FFFFFFFDIMRSVVYLPLLFSFYNYYHLSFLLSVVVASSRLMCMSCSRKCSFTP